MRTFCMDFHSIKIKYTTMTTEKKATALFHASNTFIGTGAASIIAFCLVPTQLWLIAPIVISLAGFATTRILFDRIK